MMYKLHSIKVHGFIWIYRMHMVLCMLFYEQDVRVLLYEAVDEQSRCDEVKPARMFQDLQCTIHTFK